MAGMVGLALLSSQTPARAQSANLGEFESPLSTLSKAKQWDRISERQHPGYHPEGIPVGDFVFGPTLSLDTEYDSNPQGMSNGSADQKLRISTGIVIQSRSKASGREVFLAAYSSHVSHIRNKFENHSSYKIDAVFRSHVTQGYSADLRFHNGKYTEARTDVFTQPDSLRPVQYKLTTGNIGIDKINGRLMAHVNIGVNKHQYRDGISRFDRSHLLRESLRSRTQYRSRLGLGYAFSEDAKLFGHFEYLWKQYPRLAGNGLSMLDSRGSKVMFGASFKPTPVVGIVASLGYVHQTYDNSPLSSSGLSGNIDVRWMPTRLTSIRASLSRDLATNQRQDAREDFVTSAELEVEHELRRNIVLDASVGFQKFEFGGPERKIYRWSIGTSARYRANRNLSFLAKAQLLEQHSGDPIWGRNFNQLTMSIGASLAI